MKRFAGPDTLFKLMVYTKVGCPPPCSLRIGRSHTGGAARLAVI